MKVQILAAALLLSTSSLVFAADAVVEDVVVVDGAFNWSGVYVGAQAGYAWGDSRLEFPGGNFSEPDPDGFIGGIYGGYNYQFSNNFVLGAEVDVNYSDVNGDDIGRIADGSPFGGVTVSGDLKWSGAARLRAGYAIDRFLPYVAGGVAFGSYDVTIDDNGDVSSDRQTMTGWTLGAGVDYAFTDNIIGRFEYRYTDFGNDDFFSSSSGDVDLKTSDLRIGIAYKF